MEFPLLTLTSEIRREIGPLLKRLGLRAKLTAREWGVDVEFKCPNGDFSPVELNISRKTISGEGWGNSAIRIANYVAIDVGSNGWLAHDSIGGQCTRRLPNDPKQAWAEIERNIAELRVVQIGPEREFYIKNDQFVTMYVDVERALDKKFQYRCEREHGNLSFSFEDDFGREWRVAFQGGKARIYVDGTFEAAFAKRASNAVEKYLTVRVSEPGLVAARGPTI
jgi:hypothetical protein